MSEETALSSPAGASPGRPQPRRRWEVLLSPLLILGSLLWVSNWFYQRSRLFEGADVELGEPFLPWGKLMQDDVVARAYFGVPVELDLKRKRLTPYQVRLVGSYTPLETLTVRGMTDDDLQRLSGLTNLKRLSIVDSQITDAGCRHLLQMQKLWQLRIESPHLTDACFEHLGQLNSLEYVTVMGATLSGDGLGHLNRLPKLFSINLRDADLQGQPFAPLVNGCLVRELALNGTDVTDEMLAPLVGIKSLEFVFLHGTSVSRETCLQLKRSRPDVTIGSNYDLREAMPPENQPQAGP